jgi:signal transduction histidine kinase
MGSLAGGGAHEIRNPLNTVDMAAQRLGVEYEPQEDAEGYRRLLQSLRDETRRIGRIIEDFLTYARPPKANRTDNDLTDALHQVEQTFRPAAQSEGIAFEAVYANTPVFPFDADQVRQAALNLLRNALDAVPRHDGRIRLSTGTNPEGVWVRVEDNGPGVPEEEKAKVFDLYYTTRADGTGVGLPMVHRITVEHKGRVELGRSELGGASFTMIFSRER